MKRALYTATVAALCFLFAGAAESGTKVNGTLNLGSNKNVTWYLPSGTPQAWVYLQHGYSRSRSNLDDLATAYMDAGLMVLTVDNGVTNGGSSDATKAANALVDTTITPPNGYALPAKLILSGHSAGGLHVTYMAGQLMTRNYAKLAGLILLDPVDNANAMQGRMQSAIAKGAKVYAYLASPGSCNKSNNVMTPMKNLSPNFVGVQAMNGSTHNDAEGASGGGGFSGMCGNPTQFNIDLLHEFATAWALDITTNTTSPGYYPGGARLTSLINANDMKLLKPYTEPVCGNGVIEAGERCDGGGCCDSNCQLRTAGYVCRASVGTCDLAEQCDGALSTCPADTNVPNSTSCATGKQCWDGQCITAPNCGNGTVEYGEECDGGGCCTTDCRIQAAGASCRAASGDCDVAESCDGAASLCPSDFKKPDATVCSSGICQAGVCMNIPVGWTTALSQTGLSGSSGNLKYYQFQAPGGITDVQIMLSGGSGNADLYVKKGTPVSTSVYDCRPYLSTNNETCNMQGPGTYYILIKSVSSYSSVSLVGKYNFPGSVCGNSILEAGEQCDGGACCKVDCTFAASSFVCRSSAGACDIAESCTGSNNACPPDQFVASSTQCRSASGTCDITEYCTGSAPICPTDGAKPNGTSCGTSKTCQAGACVSASMCGNGLIESGEQCDGGACCNSNCTFKSAGTQCRAAADSCDAIEYCTGSTEVCPIDAKAPNGTSCGSAGQVCDDGGCVLAPPPPMTGWIIDIDQSSLSGSTGNLKYYTFDVPDNGTDVSIELTYVSGSGDADLHVKKNASVSTSTYDCRPYKGTTTAETCTFTGPGTYNILIKAYSNFTGVRLIGKWYRTGQACGNGIVESGESCDGGACCSTSCSFKASSLVCRADAGACDVQEKCTGSSSVCPADVFSPNGTSCTGGSCAGGVCVQAPVCGNSVIEGTEQCDGGECCNTNCTYKTSNTVCRADAGACDLAETCSGTTATCPVNSYEANGTTCSSGTCQDGSCTSSGGGGWF